MNNVIGNAKRRCLDSSCIMEIKQRCSPTLELTGRGHNAETIQVDDERPANSRSG
jgi:hypothetical protein